MKKMRTPLFICLKKKATKRGKRNVREVVRFTDPVQDEGNEASKRG